MSYRKYDSRMSQRYLNQNLIVGDIFENWAPGHLCLKITNDTKCQP